MCAAAKNAKGTNPNSKEHKYYRLFVFLIATTLFHELGHIFITFLSLGDADTPPEHVPELAGIHARTEPESGNILEGKVFGGSVVHGRDPKSDDTQVRLYMRCLIAGAQCKLTHAQARRASPSRQGRCW